METAAALNDAGFECHLVKPVDPEALERVLNFPGRTEPPA
jgi:hypothetical protein